MSAEEATSEPTMEEILASIRKIISEDDAPAVNSADAEGADVLELMSDPVEEEDDVLDMAAAMEDLANNLAEPRSEADKNVVAIDVDDWADALEEQNDEPEINEDDWGISFDEIEADPEPEPAPAPKAQPQAAPAQVARAPQPADPEEGLVAEATANAAASQLGKLMGSMMLSHGMTLEDLVREMLKPMLKEWLDENLPTLVEREVAKELQRISRMAR